MYTPWSACLQLLAFCLNRGPLLGPWTSAQMAAILCLPIYPCPPTLDAGKATGRLHDQAGRASSLMMRTLVKAGQ